MCSDDNKNTEMDKTILIMKMWKINRHEQYKHNKNESFKPNIKHTTAIIPEQQSPINLKIRANHWKCFHVRVVRHRLPFMSTSLVSSEIFGKRDFSSRGHTFPVCRMYTYVYFFFQNVSIKLACPNLSILVQSTLFVHLYEVLFM